MSYIIVTFCPGAVKKARGFFTKCLMFSLFAETRRRRFFLPRQALRGTMEETHSYPFVEETAMSIDLRSDTITQPTESMRRAMAAAEVGDDVFGEDPSINRLEELSAQKTGKEAALFLPSGTMSNLVAILTHTHNNARFGEVICEEASHVKLNEVGGMATIGNLMCRPVKGVRGAMPEEAVRAAVQVTDIHHPVTALICVENTHNFAGGAVLPLQNLAAMRRVADEFSLPLHMDGARVYNAAAALGVKVSEITRYADSVSTCLSKGPSAPVGAVLNGSRKFIAQARKYRKLVGGGMRQAGILAAAGIVALTEMTERLAEDNENAKLLANGLAGMKGIGLDPAAVETNIVIFDVKATGMTAPAFCQKLGEAGVRCLDVGPYAVRFVTQRHFDKSQVPAVLKAVESVL